MLSEPVEGQLVDRKEYKRKAATEFQDFAVGLTLDQMLIQQW